MQWCRLYKTRYWEAEEEFLAGVSKPVNPDLMDIFKSCRIVERSGHGVTEVVKVYGKGAYKFSINTITVSFPFDKTGFTQGGSVNDNVNNINKSEQLIIDAISTDGFESQNESQNKPQKDEVQESIIQLIKGNPKITRKEISTILGKSISTISRVLKDNSPIKYVGFSKNGH